MGTRMDLVVLTDLPAFAVSTTSRLLKQRDVAAVTEANALLRRAESRDKSLLDQTLAAHEESRQRGFAQGLEKATRELANRLAVAQAARHVALHDLTPTLVEIVADAVAVLVKNAPRRALLASALDTVSGMIRQARWARLRVHPTQVDEARAALAEARTDMAAADIVSIVGDAMINPDGCIFETDVGIADASLDVQLAAVRTAVTSALASIKLNAGVALPGAADDVLIGNAAQAAAGQDASSIDQATRPGDTP